MNQYCTYHYYTLTLDLFLMQFKPVCIIKIYFLKICIFIIFPSLFALVFPVIIFQGFFPLQFCICFVFPHLHYMSSLFSLSGDYSNSSRRRVYSMKLLLCNLFVFTFNIFLGTLFLIYLSNNTKPCLITI
jgi:hypothetical protein